MEGEVIHGCNINLTHQELGIPYVRPIILTPASGMGKRPSCIIAGQFITELEQWQHQGASPSIPIPRVKLSVFKKIITPYSCTSMTQRTISQSHMTTCTTLSFTFTH